MDGSVNRPHPMKASPMEKTAREIAAHLRESGHIAYFAGGCVRDIVRGQTPKDFDIATDAKPENVQKLFPRTYAVGAHFGVILVLEHGFQFEIATFRSDEAYIDGRHPSAVHFSAPGQERRTRAFPLTATLCDPVAPQLVASTAAPTVTLAKWLRAAGARRRRLP